MSSPPCTCLIRPPASPPPPISDFEMGAPQEGIRSSFVPQKQIPPPPPWHLVPPFLVLKWWNHREAGPLLPPFLVLKWGDHRRAFVPLRVKKSDRNSPPSLLQAKPFPPPMSRRHPLSGRAAASPRPPISGFEMGGLQEGIRSSFVPQKQIPPPPPRPLLPPFLVLKWGDHRGAFILIRCVYHSKTTVGCNSPF